MNKQFQLLTWIYENRPNFPLRAGKMFQAYQETEDYSSSQGAFSQLLTKLVEKNLLEKPKHNHYQITESGERLAKNHLGQDTEDISRPEDYGDVVDELDEFMFREMRERIPEAQLNHEPIKFSMDEIQGFSHELADFFEQNPESFISALEEALRLHVDTSELPDWKLVPDVEYLEMDLGAARNSSKIGQPVAVEGIVKRAEQVANMIVSVEFQCVNCGQIVEKEQDSAKLKSPYKCDACGSRKFDINEKEYQDVIDFKLSRREELETTMNVRIKGSPDLEKEVQKDLMTGSRVKVLGVISDNGQDSKDSKKIESYLKAISYVGSDKKKDISEISDEKKEDVLKKIGESEDPFKDFAQSIAPGLGDLDLAKKCIAISLVGSPEFEDESVGSKEYGRIHVGIFANPGLGKSELLLWQENTFEKTYRAEGGQGSSSGLTASAQQNKGGQWEIIAGKLVFADRGFLMVDEFDKFPKGELTALNTAMESGFFDVDLATSTARLPGRATVIAAGNFQGKLDEHTFPYEILPEKGEGLYDRLALMCAITDSGEKARESIRSRFTVGESTEDKAVFDKEELRIYRHLAKDCSPWLSQDAADVLDQFVEAANDKSGGELRGESNRFLVHLIKITLSIARFNLREDTATAEDARKAVKLMRECRDSLGLAMGDSSVSDEFRKASREQKVKTIYEELAEDGEGSVETQDLEEEVVERTSISANQFQEIVSRLKSDGQFYEPSNGEVALL
jgi:replicative DNA helicase Mcm